MPSSATLIRLIQLLVAWLVVQTTVVVVLGYCDYLPPNFRADFLLGRRDYFFRSYQWAFYAHIFSGPVTLLLGLVLLSDTARRRFPRWHRRLGRVQGVLVLLLVAPSGLWMAGYAPGMIAQSGFATLALATGGCAAMGWRDAVRRRFETHRWWMLRCYALLCSAIVLRLIGGLSELTGAHWTYPLAAWISWMLPLAGVELWRVTRLRRLLHALQS